MIPPASKGSIPKEVEREPPLPGPGVRRLMQVEVIGIYVCLFCG